MEYVIRLYRRPSSDIIDEIVRIAQLLTGKWFTANVPEDTRRDLLFQDVFCAQHAGKMIAFLVFTCLDGTIHITLMGTHPKFRGQGIGSQLMERFFHHVKQLKFTRVIALTVPPDINPAYQTTVQFYQKHGFTITKRYTEIWENGAIELTKYLEM